MKRLILASQSHARKTMLQNAGYEFDCIPADIDEEQIKDTMIAAGKTPAEIAQKLASEKALYISAKKPDALVIGSDQILECDGTLLSKAENKEDAKEKLLRLKNRTHTLISAVSVAKNGHTLWQDCAAAHLKMRNFDDAFLDRYCEKAGAALTRSVGAYELEAEGVHLFDSIEGDYYTILGMPLLKLVNYLREQEWIGL